MEKLALILSVVKTVGGWVVNWWLKKQADEETRVFHEAQTRMILIGVEEMLDDRDKRIDEKIEAVLERLGLSKDKASSTSTEIVLRVREYIDSGDVMHSGSIIESSVEGPDDSNVILVE